MFVLIAVSMLIYFVTLAQNDSSLIITVSTYKGMYNLEY